MKALSQAGKRNADRFPTEFSFQLTTAELRNLKSQIVISSSEHTEFNDSKFQFGTSSGGGTRKLPGIVIRAGRGDTLHRVANKRVGLLNGRLDQCSQ